jgi:hypothetical protein
VPAINELAAWPEQLSLDSIGTDGEASQVSESQLGHAQMQLAHVTNPIGKKLLEASSIDSRSIHRALLSNQARYDGTRLFLALRVFELEHDALPEKLEQLVAAKILDALPLDPFSDRLFQYSRNLRALWSVGWNGQVSPGDLPPDYDAIDVENHMWQLDWS